jgi:predicted SnoaL-like aldol condensation-catalyzing enzyme
VTHAYLTLTPGEPGKRWRTSFRVEDGKVVEHWDVVQEIPATSANSNTMF